MLARFIMFMPPGGYQCMGVIELALRYLWRAVDEASGHVRDESAKEEDEEVATREQREEVLRSSLCRTQLGLLVHILRVICNETVGFVLEKDISEIVALVFLIIAKGRFYYCLDSTTDRSEQPKRMRMHGTETGVSADAGVSRISVRVIDMLTLSEFGISTSEFVVDALVRHWNAVAVLSTAVHTGLVAMLVSRLTVMLESVVDKKSGGGCGGTESLDFIITARLWLSIVSPFRQHSWVMHLCTSTMTSKHCENDLCSVVLDPVYWEGLHDVSHPHRHNLSVVPMEDTNKRVSRLASDSSSCADLWYIVKTSALSEDDITNIKHHTFSRNVLDRMVLQCLQRIYVMLKRVFSSTDYSDTIPKACLLLVEQLMQIACNASLQILIDVLNFSSMLVECTAGTTQCRASRIALNFVDDVINVLSVSTSLLHPLHTETNDVISRLVSILTTSVNLPSHPNGHDNLSMLVKCCSNMLPITNVLSDASSVWYAAWHDVISNVLCECIKKCDVAPEDTSKPHHMGNGRHIATAINFLYALTTLHSPRKNFPSQVCDILMLVNVLLRYIWTQPDKVVLESVQSLVVVVSALCCDGYASEIQVENMPPLLGEMVLLEGDCFDDPTSHSHVSSCLGIVFALGMSGMETTVLLWLQHLLRGDAIDSPSPRPQSIDDNCCVVEGLWGEYYQNYSNASRELVEEQLSRILSFHLFDLSYCLRARSSLKEWYAIHYPPLSSRSNDFQAAMHSSAVSTTEGICPLLLREKSLRRRLVDMFSSGDVDIRGMIVTDVDYSECPGNSTGHRTETVVKPLTESMLTECYHHLALPEWDIDMLIAYSSRLLTAAQSRQLYKHHIQSLTTDTTDVTNAASGLHTYLLDSGAASVSALPLELSTLLRSIYINECGDSSVTVEQYAMATSSLGVLRMCEGSNVPVVNWYGAILSLLALEVSSESLKVPTGHMLFMKPSAFECIELNICQALQRKENKDISLLFRRIGVSCRALVRNIVQNWFLGWLPVREVMLITLVLTVRGSQPLATDIVLTILRYVGYSFVNNQGLRHVVTSPLEELLGTLPPQCNLAEMALCGRCW